MGNLKRKPAALAMAMTGLAMLTWSLFLMLPGNATCGGQQMRQADSCVVTSGDHTVVRSVSTQRRSNRAQGIIFVAVGGALTVGGGYRMLRRARPRAPVAGDQAASGPGLTGLTRGDKPAAPARDAR